VLILKGVRCASFWVWRQSDRLNVFVDIGRPTERFVDLEVSSELKDLSCKGSLAKGEAHYVTRVMYQNSDRIVNQKTAKKRSPPQNSRAGTWQITIRPQVLIDGENCAEYGSRKSCLSSNVGLVKKGTSLPMRFLGRFCILLVFSLAFGLVCSEIPESLGLYDDTSNDFLVSGPAPKIGRVQTARREANSRQDAAPTATLPSLPLIPCAQPALPSGPNLLRLLSIQRK